MRRMIMAMVALGASVACSDVTFEERGPVSLALTADRTSVGPGGVVTFSYEAVGSELASVTLDFGDGSSAVVNLSGAQTASGRVTHAFSAPGIYVVVGTLEDNVQGPTTDELVVTVTAAQLVVVAGAGSSP